VAVGSLRTRASEGEYLVEGNMNIDLEGAAEEGSSHPDRRLDYGDDDDDDGDDDETSGDSNTSLRPMDECVDG
jgi:hypothetical protein